MSQERRNYSPLFYLLSAATLAISAWGLYGLLHDSLGMPAALALLGVCGLDVAAVLFGQHALTVAEDGDSPAPWYALLLLFGGVAMYAQFGHGRLQDWPVVGCIVMPAITAAELLLFLGQLRRKYRLRGRAAGRIEPPRSSYPLVKWIFYPGATLAATKLAVRYPGESPADLWELASKRREVAEQAAPKAIERRYRPSYAELVADGSVTEIASGTRPETSGDRPEASGEIATVSGERPDVPAEPIRTGSVRAAVQDGYRRHGDSFEDVRADVLRVVPDARDDSIRRYLRDVRRTG